MNAFDWAMWVVGSFVMFVVCGAALLFVLAFLSDKWDNRHAVGEDEHAEGLTLPWARRKK